MTPTGMRAAAQQAPVPDCTFDRVFPAIRAQVRQARRFVAGVLGDHAAAYDAITCLSELASNACLHSASARPGGTFTVRISSYRSGLVRIEVSDEGGPWVTRAHSDDWPHGLAIVAMLAAESGVYGDALSGWTSWATFCRPGPIHRGSK